jgi:hypothetical protein
MDPWAPPDGTFEVTGAAHGRPTSLIEGSASCGFSPVDSPEGLLLAFGTETNTKTLPADGMVLTKFQQWAQF